MEVSIEIQEEFGIKYNDLIQEALSQNRGLKREKGYEIHHILPRSFGGDNSKENLVKLTCFEHILVHYYKAIETLDNKMIYGFARMIDQNTSKISELESISIKEMEYFAELRAEGLKLGGHFKPVSEETKRKQSEAKRKFLAEHPDWKSPTQWEKGHKTWNKGKTYGEETRQKIKEARAKQDMSWRHDWHPSEEAREKMRQSHIGQVQSEETKEKRRQRNKELTQAKYKRYLEKKEKGQFQGSWNDYQKYEKQCKESI